MKLKTILLNFILLILISCSKDTAPNQQKNATDLIGTWQLIGSIISDGGFESTKYKEIKNGHILTFDSIGNVKANTYPCAGTYVFDKKESFIKINFGCSPITGMDVRIWESISVASDTMTLYSKACDEPCSVFYKKIKPTEKQ